MEPFREIELALILIWKYVVPSLPAHGSEELTLELSQGVFGGSAHGKKGSTGLETVLGCLNWPDGSTRPTSPHPYAERSDRMADKTKDSTRHQVCTKCPTPHPENCAKCFGFGLVGSIPITADRAYGPLLPGRKTCKPCQGSQPGPQNPHSYTERCILDRPRLQAMWKRGAFWIRCPAGGNGIWFATYKAIHETFSERSGNLRIWRLGKWARFRLLPPSTATLRLTIEIDEVELRKLDKIQKEIQQLSKEAESFKDKP